ncbi:MAG: DUF3883 domain-containing protein [Cyclobacteriaceae bacterium]
MINNLSARQYTDNSLVSNATHDEYNHFRRIKKEKLEVIAREFKKRFNQEFGHFDLCISIGNPLSRGNRLNRLWSGIYKGSSNKQYSPQISFVMNPVHDCLDVGFYFGRASSRSTKIDIPTLETRLKYLGKTLANRIQQNESSLERFQELFDNGFQAFSSGQKISPNEWLSEIKRDPKDTQIITNLYANAEGYIDSARISNYVSMLLFLMSLVPKNNSTKTSRTVKPLTPEQRAEQAARRTIIGLKGEEYVIDKETERLSKLKIKSKKYLKHVSLESDSYGYDIRSCDQERNELFIEVKSTTRLKTDPLSNSFYMSSREYNFYLNNKNKYRLYRVYGVESPDIMYDEIDLEQVTVESESYKMKIKTA